MLSFFFFFFFLKKNPIHLIGEWRHQMGVLGEFKRGVDVAHGDWFDVREGTHLLGEHPLHPNVINRGGGGFHRKAGIPLQCCGK
ncbi:hypothetical protein Hanom_Chr15g01354621 [Helianthus anomalus]